MELVGDAGRVYMNQDGGVAVVGRGADDIAVVWVRLGELGASRMVRTRAEGGNVVHSSPFLVVLADPGSLDRLRDFLF